MTPQMCDAFNALMDDALLGKKFRALLEVGGLNEILQDAMSRSTKYGADRYEFITYVDGRLRETLPMERTVHDHGSCVS